MTWRVPVGPSVRRIGELTRRSLHLVHFSWLIVRRAFSGDALADRSLPMEDQAIVERPARASSHGPVSGQTCPPADGPLRECFSSVGRLLGIRRDEARRITAFVCSREGYVPLVSLRRHREAYDWVDRLDPGNVLLLDHRALERKGDGVRLVSLEGVRVERIL